MTKAKKYGTAPDYTPNKRRDLRFIKKKQRNREKAPRNPVAGHITKSNPAKLVNPPELPTKWSSG